MHPRKLTVQQAPTTNHITEYTHATSLQLIHDMLEITDRAVLTPEEQEWRERAENLLSYDDRHYPSN